MNLLQQFQKHWQQNFSQLQAGNCQLLLAVSGGVDSVVLVDLLNDLGFHFVMAHCNFQLRGTESERDEQFVRSLGERYAKEVLVKRFDTKAFAAEKKISIQDAARELRYTWFEEIVGSWQMTDGSKHLAEKSNISYLPSNNAHILTAHHADDNIETLLMHFFRGTGIQGLSGIQPLLKDRKLIRPLLPIRKKELLGYANEKRLVFVEDSSNASDKYTRNYFRNQLLPQIREIYPRVDDNLLHNIERFNEVGNLYQQAVALHISKLMEQKGAEWHIPVLKWKKVNPLHTISWELIRPFGFHASQTEEVIKLLDGENGGYQSSATHRIIRNRNWMIIAPNQTETADHILVEKEDIQINFANGTLQITHHSPLTTHGTNEEVTLDAVSIRFPLLLRKWKTGDYFYPLGMQKKKKLSRFFIDLKLSKTEKEKVWVLESDKKILWVIGYRIDNRCKVTENTREAFLFSYRK
ncbi:MAG: tRNA lysidine(34) synthetase TilS [Bacteroidota bacterium]